MKNKQAGGIVSFVLVGLVLAGLLAGGLYLSKQQARQVRDTDTSTPQVTVNEEEKSAEEGATDSPADSPEAATSEEQAAPEAQNQSGSTTPVPNSTNRVATTGPSDAMIPATGPAELIAVLAGLTALTFASYRFVDARRGLRRSALRR